MHRALKDAEFPNTGGIQLFLTDLNGKICRKFYLLFLEKKYTWLRAEFLSHHKTNSKTFLN